MWSLLRVESSQRGRAGSCNLRRKLVGLCGYGCCHDWGAGSALTGNDGTEFLEAAFFAFVGVGFIQQKLDTCGSWFAEPCRLWILVGSYFTVHHFTVMKQTGRGTPGRGPVLLPSMFVRWAAWSALNEHGLHQETFVKDLIDVDHHIQEWQHGLGLLPV